MKTLLLAFLAFAACSPVFGCAPSLHPCAVAYRKAGECPECSADEIEARVAAVDLECGHLVNGAGK